MQLFLDQDKKQPIAAAHSTLLELHCVTVSFPVIHHTYVHSDVCLPERSG